MSENTQAQVQIERIYLKDASFESPSAPAVFAQSGKPGFQLDLHTQVATLGENRHEVVLSATVTAKVGEEVAYIVEVQQAGVFVVQGAEGEALRALLSIAGANLLFPYLREGADALVIKGGFPALQLAPVNFEAMYLQAMQQQQAAAAEDAKH